MENKNIMEMDLVNHEFEIDSFIKLSPHELLKINESIEKSKEEFRKEREEKIKLLVAVLDCFRTYIDKSGYYFDDRRLEEKLKEMYKEEFEDKKQQLLEELQKKEDEQ